MSYYAVLDTNILAASLLSKHPDSATVQIVSRMISGELIPIYSAEIMTEYKNVLSRKKFRFDSDLISYLTSAVEKFGLCITPTATGEILPDMKDLPFYEVVYEKKEDGAYLVTGNLKHFPVRPYIVTARQMLDIMDHVNEN